MPTSALAAAAVCIVVLFPGAQSGDVATGTGPSAAVDRPGERPVRVAVSATATTVVTPPDKPRPTPMLTLVGADTTHVAEVAVAVERFERANLALPPLEIVFGSDDAVCQGHPGTFDQHRDPWRISVCSDLEFVLTHELAHAWAAANLKNVEREQYATARGYDNWADHDAPWDERATEDAAFIVQQNLMMSNVSLESTTWVERAEAYELLTGTPSPLLAG